MTEAIATPLTDAVERGLIGFPFPDTAHPLVDLSRSLERDRARLIEALKPFRDGNMMNPEEYCAAVDNIMALLAELEPKEGEPS